MPKQCCLTASGLLLGLAFSVCITRAPGQIGSPGSSETSSSPDYVAHAAALRRRLSGRGFTVVIQAPFVVVGDEPAARVRQRAEGTVKWAVDLLKKDFFARDPEHILDIWLFRDRTSYRNHAREFFGEEPDTPFGYYSSRHRALVMNIATGGGTLVHEIVHPFVAANFPECPTWFNEGLASLYEQCHERDGHITGLPNWRLDGLKEAIRAQGLASFEKLISAPSGEFYRAERGTNYAQARYLLYYLQEKGLLARFYREFCAARLADPTGLQTLKKVLGREDLSTFQKEWEAFVLALRR